jgi:hypothetical protein
VKKLIAIFFLISYFASASGLAFNVHYCGGEIDSIKLDFGQTKKTCGCGSKKMDKDCCKDKKVVAKIKDAHKGSDTKIVFKVNIQKLLAHAPQFPQTICFVPNHSQLSSTYAHAPPIIRKQAIYILYCVYRI